ncbi:MAG: T9SS type A sorting domain-containing protein, partial [Candidatus Fibromonas sp.]|nr:T9SS type A sorting domain-containing protein [Candidatus Fibromonas sp.]
SSYYGWADEDKGASYTIDGGNFNLNLSNGDWAGFGTWFGSGKLGKCQHGVAYSYRGAAHVFQVVTSALEEFDSGRSLERAKDWTKVDHLWSYFTDVDRNSLQEFGWNISAGDVNKNSDSLQIKDVLCLESGILPINSPQIVSANRVTQIRSGINLHAANGAVVEIFSLKGNLVGKRYFGGGAHTISLGHLPKGMYIVKVLFGSEKRILRVPVNRSY